MPLPEGVHLQIEDHLRERLIELVIAGVDVVLDFSFWSRQMRDDYRKLLRPLGVEPETICLATTREVVLARIHQRAAAHAGDFPLAEDLAAASFDSFEMPTLGEGPLTVIS